MMDKRTIVHVIELLSHQNQGDSYCEFVDTQTKLKCVKYAPYIIKQLLSLNMILEALIFCRQNLPH
jgi:hypothetical protein